MRAAASAANATAQALAFGIQRSNDFAEQAKPLPVADRQPSGIVESMLEFELSRLAAIHVGLSKPPAAHPMSQGEAETRLVDGPAPAAMRAVASAAAAVARS